jgi:hypothetical protein
MVRYIHKPAAQKAVHDALKGGGITFRPSTREGPLTALCSIQKDAAKAQPSNIMAVQKGRWLQSRKRRVLKGRNPNDSYLLFINKGWFMVSTWGGDLSSSQLLRGLYNRD